MSNEIITGRDVLRLLADGVSIDDFEYRSSEESLWQKGFGHWSAEMLRVSNLQFRRKPKTRVINGFTVPEPVREQPQHGQDIFVASGVNEEWYFKDRWTGLASDHACLQRGLIFWRPEYAIATAKAMVGVDPNKEN